MRPNVLAKKDNIRCVVFVLPIALQEIAKAGFEKPSDKNVRDLITSITGGSTDFKSSFPQQAKKTCVRVPRPALSQLLLQQIDSCMYM